MPFYLVMPKSKMGCGVCRNEVKPPEMLFQSKIVIEGIKYPLNRNICIQCANRMTDPDFVASIEKIYNDIQELKTKAKETKERAF